MCLYCTFLKTVEFYVIQEVVATKKFVLVVFSWANNIKR